MKFTRKKGGDLNRRVNCCISGSNGFLGKALSARLERLGHNIISLPRDLLFHPISLRGWVTEKHPDYLFHLASYGNHSYQQDESRIVKANILGSFNFLFQTRDIPYKLFTSFGSSSEYGTSDKPMSEFDLPNPKSCYGASKAAGTMIGKYIFNMYHKPIVTVRPFSVYGPGEADFRFIPTVIHNIKEGKEIRLDPFPVHDWIYIDDFIDGLMAVMDQPEKVSGKIVNIGTGLQVTNADIVATIQFLMGKKTTILEVPRMRSYDSRLWRADNHFLKSLKWEPKFGLTEGLRRTIDHYTA